MRDQVAFTKRTSGRRDFGPTWTRINGDPIRMGAETYVPMLTNHPRNLDTNISSFPSHANHNRFNVCVDIKNHKRPMDAEMQRNQDEIVGKGDNLK